MNILKQKGTLISLGFDKDEVENLLIELEEMNKFTEYMKSRYGLDSDKEVEDMYNIYMKTRKGEIEELLMKKMKNSDLEDYEIMIEATIELTKSVMSDYAEIHEYKDIDKYNKSLDVYLNEIIRTQIIQKMINN